MTEQTHINVVKIGETNMVRRTQGSDAARTSGPKIGLFFTTALASIALASCTASAPPAQVSFGKAQSELEKGNVEKAIGFAEAAVLAAPRDPEYRAMLGTAYMQAGRFQSAATSFGDAMELGDRRARTVLGYGLTKAAIGENRAAAEKLYEHANVIPQVDLGLALALAGEADRGVEFLVNAIRSGNATPKSRQNLAYAYALAGNWRAARVMAAEDVAPGQLDARLSEWAASARPEDHMVRVSKLLGLTPVSDGGLPQHLALSNFPTQPQMVAEAEKMAETDEAPVEVAAAPRQSEAMLFGIDGIDKVAAAPASAIESFDPTPVAQSTPAPAVAMPQRSTPRFVSQEVTQQVPASAQRATERAPTRVAAAPKPATEPRPAPVASGSADTHLIQLGSFDSRQVAEQKWNDFKRRFPALSTHDVVITEALVNGRTYYRVAAAGFGSSSAASMCGTVKASGVGCFAYAKTNPPAGAVDRGVRIAARAR